MPSRYLMRPFPTADFMSTGFATRDAAVEWAKKFSKSQAAVFIYDTADSPHRLVCKCEKGKARFPVCDCKKCVGRGWIKPSGDTCQDCEGMGCRLEAAAWSAG